MQAPAPTKRRKLILVGILCLLVFLGLMLVRNGLHNTTSTNSNVLRKIRLASAQTPQDGITRSLAGPKSPETALVIAGNTSAMPAVGTSTNDNAPFASDRFPKGGTVFLGDSASSAFAVVDLQRVLDAIQFQSIPKNERPEALKNIQRIIALRAVSHRLRYVLDISLPADAHAPFVLYADITLDITSEVLQDLSLKLSANTLPAAATDH